MLANIQSKRWLIIPLVALIAVIAGLLFSGLANSEERSSQPAEAVVETVSEAEPAADGSASAAAQADDSQDVLTDVVEQSNAAQATELQVRRLVH